MSTRLDGVVLAGGASRRMGTDKATIVLEGQRLVDRAADRLAVVVERVWVARGARPLGRADELADVPGFSGPLAGVLAGLRASDADLLAVVPVDAPFAVPHVVQRLASLVEAGDRAAAVVSADGHLQSLHAVIATSAAAAVEARVGAGERSVRRLLGWLDAVRVDVDGWGDLDAAGASVDDWDRPEDLPDDLRPA